MTTPADLQACLVQDVHQLLLHAPSILLRVPTSLHWGLAPQPIGSSIWYAISVEGCARIALRRRPWVYQRGIPDLSALAASIAARFKHAEPKDRVGQYLFALDESLGPCGKSCLLAHATDENFPWVLPSEKPTPNSTIPAIDPQEWARLCSLSMEDHGLLVSGGSLPAANDLKNLLVSGLSGFDMRSLRTEEGRSRLRILLEEVIDRERRRLHVLANGWISKSPNPYEIPAWLEAGGADAQLDQFIASCTADMQSASPPLGLQRTSGDSEAAPAPQEKPRRPTVVPIVQPPRPLTGRTDDDFSARV